jgi:hypothetical protein
MDRIVADDAALPTKVSEVDFADETTARSPEGDEQLHDTRFHYKGLAGEEYLSRGGPKFGLPNVERLFACKHNGRAIEWRRCQHADMLSDLLAGR